jgi:hypothetical protein
MTPQVPATLWEVFCARWVQVEKAPADAPDWLAKGYLQLVPQGKLLGYAIAQPGYRWIMGC